MRRALFGERGYGLDALGTEASVQKHPGRRSEGLPPAVRPSQQLRPGHLRRHQHRPRSEPPWKRPSAPGNPPRAASDSGLWTPDSGLDQARHRDPRQEAGGAGHRLPRHDRPRCRPVCRWSWLQEACSDLGSRLFLRIREKLGLAYYVGAQNVVGLAPGYFAFYAGTDAGKGRPGGNGTAERGRIAAQPRASPRKNSSAPRPRSLASGRSPGRTSAASP